MKPLFLAVALACALPAVADTKADQAAARTLLDDAKKKHGKPAIDLYTQAIEKDPALADAWIGRGAERRIDEPMEALADFAHADAIKDEFQSAGSFWRAVTLLEGLLDRSAAWEELDRLRKRGTGVWAFMAAGIQKMLLGRWDEAVDHFDKVIGNDDKTPLVYRFKSIACWELGNIAAPEAATLASKMAPDDPSVQASGAMVDGLKDWMSAGKTLERIATEHPRYAWTQVALAKLFQKNLKWEESLGAIDAAEKVASGGSETACLRGLAQVQLGKLAEAEKSLTFAVVGDSNYAIALAARGDLRLKLKDWGGALRDYQEWRARFALIVQEQKEYDDKIAAAKEKLDRDTMVLASVEGYCQRAVKYMEEGDLERAEKDLQTAEGMDAKHVLPKRIWMHYWARKNDIEKVFQACQTAIDNGDMGFAVLYDKQQGGKDFEEIKKEAKFLELSRKLTLKTAEDIYTRGELYYDLGMAAKANPSTATPLYRESAAEYGKLIEQFPEHRLVAGSWYNACCCYSLAGDIDKAFEALDKAIDKGFDQVAHMEKNDTDLENMRKDPRFPDLVKKIKEKTGRDK